MVVEYTKDMEFDLYGAQKRVWKMLQKQKKNVNECIQINNITKEEWTGYFRKQLPQSKNPNMTVNHGTNNTKIVIPMEKIKEHIQQLKNRKSPGLDFITNEMIKYGSESLHKQIQRL